MTNGDDYGLDFNPTVDRIRVTNDADENLRINPNNGARADTPTNDTNINPAGNQIKAATLAKEFRLALVEVARQRLNKYRLTH